MPTRKGLNAHPTPLDRGMNHTAPGTTGVDPSDRLALWMRTPIGPVLGPHPSRCQLTVLRLERPKTDHK